MRKIFQGIIKDLAIIIGILVVVAGMVSIFLMHVKNEVQITKIGYELADVTRTHRSLIEDNRRLRVEAAMLRRTDRVIARAKTEFNLQLAKPSQVILISEKSSEHIQTAMK